MNSKCVIGSIKHIAGMIENFIADEVKMMDYPISKKHIYLFYLLPGDGGMMIFNVLCNKWGISKSSLSDIVTKYVDLGFVEKHDCKDDKRVIYLSLTAEGDKVRKELLKIEADFNKKIFKGFDSEQQKLLKYS